MTGYNHLQITDLEKWLEPANARGWYLCQLTQSGYDDEKKETFQVCLINNEYVPATWGIGVTVKEAVENATSLIDTIIANEEAYQARFNGEEPDTSSLPGKKNLKDIGLGDL